MEIYSGCENTFIICMYQSQKDHAAYAQMVCKNKIDGFMMVKTTPLEMVLYNQDGSLASMCGNGIRCFMNTVIVIILFKKKRIWFSHQVVE